MKNFILQLFTWWNGTTMGTRFFTWRKGNRVGEDDMGNVYYEGDGGKRWVQYAGYADASAIPAGWHGWMHHRTDVSPVDETYQTREWQKPHKANKTGTTEAYLPKGSMGNHEERDRVTGEYDAWTP